MAAYIPFIDSFTYQATSCTNLSPHRSSAVPEISGGCPTQPHSYHKNDHIHIRQPPAPIYRLTGHLLSRKSLVDAPLSLTAIIKMIIFELFFKMLIGHAVCDFVLQNDAMGAGKNRNNALAEQRGPQFPRWYYWLTAHALVHGGAVYLITANPLLGLIETTLHWIIDFGKCEGRLSVAQDQTLHILCKIGYCWWLVY